jgi:peptidoglycan/LPS O-acetylase OafA/YrhL
MKDQTALKDSRRFYELDLLRFFAAFAVVLFHYTHYGPMVGHFVPFEYPVLDSVFRFGFLGVDLFFIISGFVILMSAQKRNWAGFVVSRIARLYPAYWFSVTLTALVILAVGNSRLAVDLPQYLVNMTMLQTPLGFRDVDGAYWSLFVELNFYLLIFLVSVTGQMKHVGKFFGGWLLAVIIINVFGGITFTDLDQLLLPHYGFYFIAGGAFYLIHQRGPSLYLVSLVAISYVMAIRRAVADTPDSRDFLVAGIISMFFLIFAAIASNRFRPIEKPWMITVGLLTYPLYLIHQNIGYFLLSGFAGAMQKHVLLLLVVAIMLLASYLIAFQVERRFGPPLKMAATRLLSMVGIREFSLKLREA